MAPDKIGDPEGLLRHRLKELRDCLNYLDQLRGNPDQIGRQIAEAEGIDFTAGAAITPAALARIRMWVQIDKIARIVTDLQEEHP